MTLPCPLTYLRNLLKIVMKRMELIHYVLHLYPVILGFSLPESTWEAALKQTKIEMEKIQKAHLFLYSENAFRGGITGCMDPDYSNNGHVVEVDSKHTKITENFSLTFPYCPENKNDKRLGLMTL